MNKALYAAFYAVNLFLPAIQAQATPSIEVGFSPEGSAQQLVLNTIDSARQSIRLMGYSFTSPKVVKALVAAHQRGIDVKIVLDERGNHSKASVAAMNIIVNAGIPLRTNGHFAIQHDKIFVVDSQTVESGSYNWTQSAATRNSRTPWCCMMYRNSHTRI